MSPRPTTTIDSLGSVWFFDENEMVYLRAPRTEGPRPSPPGEDWGGLSADIGLQDLVWHSFVSWRLEPMPPQGALVVHADGAISRQYGDYLVIELPGGRVTAPKAVVRSLHGD